MKRKLIIIFLCIMISLLILEGFLRLFSLAPTRVVNESIYPDLLGDYKPAQDFISDFVVPHHIKVNSLGLRGSEISAEKPKGFYRILLLGDSYTAGERVNYEESFAFQLQKLLNKDNFNKRNKIEVVNGGHGAYSTREEYEYFLERGILLNPDMVIIFWFPNDVAELSRGLSWRDLLKEHYKFEPFKSYIRSSAIYNALRNSLSYYLIKSRFSKYVPQEESNIFDARETVAEKRLWKTCFNYILKIKNICGDDIRLILVALEEPEQFKSLNSFRPQLKMKTFAQENQITFVDLTERFLAKRDIDKYYLLPKDPHLSAEGNALVANEMRLFLETYLNLH